MRTYLTRLSLKVEEVWDDIRPALELNIENISLVVECSLDHARVGSATVEKEGMAVHDFLNRWVVEKSDPRIAPHHVQNASLTISIAAFDHIITNLVENGLKFGTSVTIYSTATPVTISILDDGPGIPEAELQHALEPIVTLNEARTADETSTGLGLAISNLLVQQAGGRLELSNRPEGGLCTRLLFG